MRCLTFDLFSLRRQTGGASRCDASGLIPPHHLKAEQRQPAFSGWGKAAAGSLDVGELARLTPLLMLVIPSGLKCQVAGESKSPLIYCTT